MADTVNPSGNSGGRNRPPSSPQGTSSTVAAGGAQNPDAVQKSLFDVWGWLEKNAKLLAVVLVILLLGVIAQSTMSWMKSKEERSAQEAYFAIESKFTKLKEGFDRARFQSLLPGMAPEAGKNTQAATGDLSKDYGTLVTDLENFAKANSGTVAGAQAAILAADTYIEYKQPEKAVEITDTVAQKLSEKHIIGSLARVTHGNALAAKGDCQAAVSSWQKVLDTKSATHLHADVSLRSGICFEKLNQTDKAMEMYRKVTVEAPDSAAGMTAKSLLRALELKPKQAAQQG